VLAPGDPLPETSVWTAPREQRRIAELVEDAPALFLFYLFDWSST
jgi:hypothetical protein